MSTRDLPTPAAFSRAFFAASRWHRFIVLWILVLGTVGAVVAFDSNSMQAQLVARFGSARLGLLKDWLSVIQTTSQQNEEVKLRKINDFVNRNIVFEDDINIWQQSDYWATPLETIGQGRGDCEDFSIFKYVSLRLAGVPESKLRLVYVRARVEGEGRAKLLAHMVLAYYARPDAVPLILDNLKPAILPATKRGDLYPIFSFNSEGIYAGVSGQIKAAKGGTGRLSRWEDVLRRLRAEGY